MHFGELKTGGMKKDEFLSLRDNIKEHGLINPIIVEVDGGSPPRDRIAMGNNRVEVVEQLGDKHVKALVFFKSIAPPEELGEHIEITDTNLEAFMEVKHPGDNTWKKSSWADRLLKYVAARAA
jgi:hypothetical protein